MRGESEQHSTGSMAARLLRSNEGQKILLASLRQNFSTEVPEEAFHNFEKALEGLVTVDNENKKSVLDQVDVGILVSVLNSSPGVPRVPDPGAPDRRLPA